MHPSLHVSYAGQTILPDVLNARGRVGAPVWNLRTLLRDLELRLGIPQVDGSPAVRIQRWSSRLSRLVDRAPFYARSYRIDPVGTARTLLTWRDGLVDAGWNGSPIADGGERLATIAALEALDDVPMPPGDPDRLAIVERALASHTLCVYESLTLFDEAACLPGRWRRVLDRLVALGARLERGVVERGAAPIDSDLGRAQAALRGETFAKPALRGDGTLFLVRADSTSALAEVSAAIVRSDSGGRSVVIRSGNLAPLAASFEAQRLAGQGVASTSRWRPALQILPLTMELAFEPRDPYRVLELLTLPIGPFAGIAGRELASAVSSSPGIGGPEWREARSTIAERVALWAKAKANADGASEVDANAAAAKAASEVGERIADWFEIRGFEPSVGATPAQLSAVAARVSDWLRRRLATAEGDDTLGAAYAQAVQFAEAVGLDPRERLDLVAVRQLIETVGAGELAMTISDEQAGRVDHVDDACGVRASRDLVMWWHATDPAGVYSIHTAWRTSELRALTAAGIQFSEPDAILAAQSEAARVAILAARRRVVLAFATDGDDAVHPIWDELVARLGADGPAVGSVTLTVSDLLAGRSAVPGLTVDAIDPLLLPEGRASWTIATGIEAPPHLSPTGLEQLVGCPLRWVLERRAGLREGSLASVPEGPILFGSLGHRLVEILHGHGELSGEPEAVAVAAGTAFDRLIVEEGATLLRPGMALELSQLRSQLVAAARNLSALLTRADLELVSVEHEVEAPWGARTLNGRIDLLLRTRGGRDAIMDLKWGEKSYREKLENGQAIQLAAYGYAQSGGRDAFPPVAYFTLASGRALTTEQGAFGDARVVDGRSAQETWKAVNRTLLEVERLLARRTVPVTGVRASLPILEQAGVPESELVQYFALKNGDGCKYCEFDVICGRKWEVTA
ncbi:MAG: PD-(D/E)XK nuclease family protein [Polyangiales bacterium]